MARQIRNIVTNLKQISAREQVAGQELDPGLALLRVWQGQRLVRTYADLLEEPRYRPACQFFLDDIYAARDFSQRDHDLEMMYEFMRRFVPESISRPAALTINLHRMTEALDKRLLDVLVNQLSVTDTITIEQYAEAYRLCDNHPERVDQIASLVEICAEIDAIVRNPLTAPALAISRGPLRAAGYGEITGFLERGYDSFKRMHGSRHLRKTIQERELDALSRIYARDPDPFVFQLPATPQPEQTSEGSEA